MGHSKELQTPIQPCTFGKSRLAVSLAGILNETNDRHLANRIYGLFANYATVLRDLSSISNFQTYEYVLRMVRADYLPKVEYLKEAHPVLHTHARNWLVARYWDALRARTILNPKTGRMRPVKTSSGP